MHACHGEGLGVMLPQGRSALLRFSGFLAVGPELLRPPVPAGPEWVRGVGFPASIFGVAPEGVCWLRLAAFHLRPLAADTALSITPEEALLASQATPAVCDGELP